MWLHLRAKRVRWKPLLGGRGWLELRLAEVVAELREHEQEVDAANPGLPFTTLSTRPLIPEVEQIVIPDSEVRMGNSVPETAKQLTLRISIVPCVASDNLEPARETLVPHSREDRSVLGTVEQLSGDNQQAIEHAGDVRRVHERVLKRWPVEEPHHVTAFPPHVVEWVDPGHDNAVQEAAKGNLPPQVLHLTTRISLAIQRLRPTLSMQNNSNG